LSTVLVTGAGGFIGQAVTAHLLEKGFHVIAVVRRAAAMERFSDNPRVRIVECALNEIGRIAQLLPPGSVQHAIHLAWEGNAGAARADVALQMRNTTSTLALIEALHAVGCRSVLAAGTISECLILDENQICKTGNMIYAAAKAGAHALTKALCSKLNVRFTWCRLANIYGPGNRTGNIMSYTLEKLLCGERPTYSSATALQDFMYVDDCARALVAVMRHDDPRPVYYIGTGQPRLLRDYLFLARDAVNAQAELGIGERPDEPAIYREAWFSIDALQADTGFRPRVEFREGILKTIEERA